jgi:SAM-dependent methyltransferase
VREYYDATIAQHGPVPAGVDWLDLRTQRLRFSRLLRVVPQGHAGRSFSLNDFGCGYGALLDFVAEKLPASVVDYCGIDLAPGMIRHARSLHPGARFTCAQRSPRTADYTVASGVFNVRLENDDKAWGRYVRDTLRHFVRTSTRGIAVDFLAPRPSWSHGSGALFRPDPQPLVHFLENLGARVTLDADYGLPEFTLLAKLESS